MAVDEQAAERETMPDHFIEAAAYARRAEHYANADSIRDHGVRESMVSFNVRMAQVHATIAVAQRLDTIIGLVFDEGRRIGVTSYHPTGF